MRCWIVYIFLALAKSNFGVAGKGTLQYRQDDILEGQAHNLLQRRGNKKKSKGRAGGSGNDGKPPANPTRTEIKGLSILPPSESLSSLKSQQPESPKSQGKETSPRQSVSPQRNLFTTASRQSESLRSEDSRRLQLPSTVPPRAAFSFPSGHAGSSAQASQGKQPRSKRIKTKAKESTLPDRQSNLSRLRVTQSSGATQTTSDIEASSISPSGMSPLSQQTKSVPTKQPISPRSKSSSSHSEFSSPQRRMSPPRHTSPQRQQPIPRPRRPPPDPPLAIDEGIPAAQGVFWLPDQKRVKASWKQLAEAEQAKQATIQSAIGIAENDKALAKMTRHLDNQHIREASTALSNGRALDPNVMAAVQKSKDSTRKAVAFTYALSRSHGQAADLLAENNQHTEAVKHFQKSNRAYARQELRLQHGQASDYKYVNKGVKDGLDKHAADGVTPPSTMIQRAVAQRRSYKTAAEGYHQAWRDYQTVRQEFSGSSSEESEKSTFDEIVPGRRKKKEEEGRAKDD